MTEKDGGPQHLVLKVEKLLRRNFRKNVRVCNLARRFGVTPNYLSATYHFETGKTITGALLERRMEFAKKLFRKTRLNVRKVSKAVGFKYPYYFSRRFRQYQKSQPKTYRKQIQGNGFPKREKGRRTSS